MKTYLEQLVHAGVVNENRIFETDDAVEYIIANDYELYYFYYSERIIDRFEESDGEIVAIIDDADYDNFAIDVNPADITIIKKTVVTVTELLGE